MSININRERVAVDLNFFRDCFSARDFPCEYSRRQRSPPRWNRIFSRVNRVQRGVVFLQFLGKFRRQILMNNEAK